MDGIVDGWMRRVGVWMDESVDGWDCGWMRVWVDEEGRTNLPFLSGVSS